MCLSATRSKYDTSRNIPYQAVHTYFTYIRTSSHRTVNSVCSTAELLCCMCRNRFFAARDSLPSAANNLTAESCLSHWGSFLMMNVSERDYMGELVRYLQREKVGSRDGKTQHKSAPNFRGEEKEFFKRQVLSALPEQQKKHNHCLYIRIFIRNTAVSLHGSPVSKKNVGRFRLQFSVFLWKRNRTRCANTTSSDNNQEKREAENGKR